ncbi:MULTISPECIES: outer membrane protein [unclassified Phaeobacter]|uniref:outer membrane protein n=1 Tax=unclassified Phaeobacter TaxID=2621772 RepID=UPI003A86B2AD
MIPAKLRTTLKNCLSAGPARRSDGSGHLWRGAAAGLVLSIGMAGPVGAGDWSGFFLGASMARVTGAASDGGTTSAPGLHLGYDHDFGRVILGGEVEVDRSGGAGDSQAEDQTHRIKLRAGYDMGETLGYVTIGSARRETATDSDNGAVYGLGVSYSLNRALRLSGEYLHQDANDGAALQAPARDILSIRASFQF